MTEAEKDEILKRVLAAGLSDRDVDRIADAVVAKISTKQLEGPQFGQQERERVAHEVIGKVIDMTLRVLNETEKGLPEPGRRVVRVVREKVARYWYEVHRHHDTSWGDRSET